MNVRTKAHGRSIYISIHNIDRSTTCLDDPGCENFARIGIPW